jgi:hypothetical protein
MEEKSSMPSLLQCLNPHSGYPYLKISLISEDPYVLEKTSFPFLTINDSAPLSRLIDAKFVTDAGSEISKISLLVQRDKYMLTKDDLRPLTNMDIKNIWQNACSFYAHGKKDDTSVIFLSNQLSATGELTPIPSLFYCKTRHVFFHPPCPKCGQPLGQCEDDDLLVNAGLLPYSRSLKRYLYCSSCASTGKLDFYVYETDQSDPPGLKDRWSLIKKFKLLSEDTKNIIQFPCINCPNHKECFGPEQKVTSRIVPFSFYPFYMLVFKAASLNALEFLSLVSGATFQELESELEKRGESGRASCLKIFQKGKLDKPPFLFDSDERYFLEVLYLKLSFLGELLQELFPGKDFFRHPDLRPSIDSIWVDLPEHDSLRLPFIWNFRVRTLDIFNLHFDKDSFPELPEPDTLFFTALVWFYTLLVNSRQDTGKVYISLKEAIKQYLSDKDFSPETSFNRDLYLTFSPVNIFWNPGDRVVRQEWYPVWEKSLCLGWSLLKAGLGHDPEYSQENLLKQLEELRKQIKDNLFSKEVVEYREDIQAEDRAIHGILKNIYDKWKHEQNKEVISETVIISDNSTLDSKETLSAKHPEEPKETLPETVIISKQDAEGSKIPPPEKQTPTSRINIIEETVIISSDDLSSSEKTSPETHIPQEQKSPEKKIKKSGQDELDETIILKPGETQNNLEDGKT